VEQWLRRKGNKKGPRRDTAMEGILGTGETKGEKKRRNEKGKGNKWGGKKGRTK